MLAQQRIGRLVFGKRPLAARGYLESAGFHLVGLPEVYMPETAGSERQVVAIIDAVAEELAERGLDLTLKERQKPLLRFHLRSGRVQVQSIRHRQAPGVSRGSISGLLAQ